MNQDKAVGLPELPPRHEDFGNWQAVLSSPEPVSQLWTMAQSYAGRCIAAERERCAQIAEKQARSCRDSMRNTFDISEATNLKIALARECEAVAAAIRKGE